MPMYNSENYVIDAIMSVIKQSYQKWELLVIDDGSTDNSINIVNKIVEKDKRIKLIYNDRHINMPSAPRNYGIKHATGQYIAFLDSDDKWLPNKLSRQIELFHHNNNVGIVYSNYEKINTAGERCNRIVTAPSKVNYHDMLHCNYIGNLTGIIDRKRIGDIIIPDVHHEDYAMWLSILKRGVIAKNTNTVEALYRVRNSSISSSKLHLLSWQWNIYRNIEHISLLKSVYYYLCYAINGWKKDKI